MNYIFCLFQTQILQATQAVKTQFKLDKNSSSSNSIFQTRYFKILAQINTALVFLGSKCVTYTGCIFFTLKTISLFSRSFLIARLAQSDPRNNFVKGVYASTGLSCHLCVKYFPQLSFDLDMHTKSTAADYVNISESNEHWEKYSTQR